MKEKTALTIKETAHEFQFPEFAIRTLVKRGAFPVIQVGNRVYITREVFAHYLKEGGQSMLLHVDNVKFKVKPTKAEIGAIKCRFAKSASIREMTVKQVADCLIAGRTVQPGVTPYTDSTKAKGYKGTSDDDFTQQTLFMSDIDNESADAPQETPEHVAELLAAFNLKPVFMYESYHSTAQQKRFRFAVVCDEAITDRAERDAIQGALIALSPQSDYGTANADRMYFGTDKGIIEGFTDYEAVCRKADLLTLAGRYHMPDKDEPPRKAPKAAKTVGSQFGQTIPTGQRHATLVSFASTVLTKYGITEQAHDAFMQRVAQCAEPKPDDEIEKIWRDACAYYQRSIATNPEYLPPAEYMAQNFAESYVPMDYTDVGQATIFTKVYGERVKYTPATKFIVYNGQVWQESEIKAQGLSQELTDKQLEEARLRVRRAQDALNAAVERGDNDEIDDAKKRLALQENYRGYVLGRRKSDKVKACLTETRPKVETEVAQLDRDGYLLNTPGGTVDLRTGEVKPHDPADFCTKITTVAPDTVNADIFAAFMERVTMGDKQLARYLQEVAGMCAVGRVLRENLIIAYGEGGNGKSTLFNLLARVLGDYSGALSAETLTANCRKNKSPEYAELRGKRLIIAAELEEGMRLDTAIVKKLCSTDPILAEKKYKDPFTFVPSHTVILYTNHLPKIGTNDKGTWDRIIAVPFKANFRGMKGEIKNYADYLFDHCGGAVLTWIIQGAQRFIANDYNIEMPECVKQAITQYRANNDWLENFLAECCEIDPRYTQKSGELYTRYKVYCDATGDYRRSLADFKQGLAMAGYDTRKTMTGAIVYGLRVVSEFMEVDEPTPWSNPPLTG